MNYIVIFSYDEFVRYKELFGTNESCFILPKELDEKINEKNKIILKNELIDNDVINKISINAKKVFIFSFLKKSKQPLENNSDEFSSFIKSRFIRLIKFIQPLIQLSRVKKIPIIFFTQEIASFANSFDFFNILFISMMESFLLGLWNELRKFGVRPQLFILSQNFKNSKKLMRKVKANNKPLVKLGLKSNFFKKTKSSSTRYLSKVSYA